MKEGGRFNPVADPFAALQRSHPKSSTEAGPPKAVGKFAFRPKLDLTFLAAPQRSNLLFDLNVLKLFHCSNVAFF